VDVCGCSDECYYVSEVKCAIAVAKAAFNKKRALFTSKMDLGMRKKLVKLYIWSIALYGAETWMGKYYSESRSRGISYMK
jgi:hypothetical protein